MGRRPTPKDDFAAFAETIRSFIAETSETPSYLAFSIAGVVDPDTQRLTCANIPCIHNRSLAADLEAELGFPVLIANDADCFAMAEAELGAGRGHRIVFGAILGTGVGGGLVSDGRLVNASGGFAGEWGHGPSPRLRSRQSARDRSQPFPAAAARRAASIQSAAPAASSGFTRRCTTSTSQARKSSRNGNGVRKRRRARSTSIPISSPRPWHSLINITGATIVPVGGGLSNVEPLLAELDKAVRGRTLRRFDRPLIVRSECRLEPGLIGAALLGLKAGSGLRAFFRVS